MPCYRTVRRSNDMVGSGAQPCSTVHSLTAPEVKTTTAETPIKVNPCVVTAWELAQSIDRL